MLRGRALADTAAEGTKQASTFGRAKSCILLFMWGGPAQQDTWDLKPDAPAEIRGEFSPIATKVPGIQICEHFPQLAHAHRPAGHRALDDARRRGSHDRHALPADRSAAAEDARAAGRLAAHWRRAVAAWGAGAIRCRRSCRCGRSWRTTCRGSSSRRTDSRPAGWARRSIRCRSTPTRRGTIIAWAISGCRPRSAWRGSDARRALLGDINAQLARPGQARGADGHGPARRTGRST